jgi:hypothetical protein
MSLLRTHDWCEILPARLAYISMVGDRDNNDDEIPRKALYGGTLGATHRPALF